MPIIRRRSPQSLLFYERDIDVDRAKFDVWFEAWAEKLDGMPALQAYFPDLSAGDREFLFSGVTPEEWEIERINAERAEQGRGPISSLDEISDDWADFGIEQRSKRVKVPGSIVFRDEDYHASPRVYVDDLAAGSLLAAKHRDTCFYVDVLSLQDEIVHSWVGGVPVEGDTIAKALSEKVEAQEFRKDDDEEIIYLFEDRTYAAGALENAFTTAIEPPIDNVRGLNEALEEESFNVHAESKDLGSAERTASIARWLSDTDRTFVPVLLEFWALNIGLASKEEMARITDFGAKLAELEAHDFGEPPVTAEGKLRAKRLAEKLAEARLRQDP